MRTVTDQKEGLPRGDGNHPVDHRDRYFSRCDLDFMEIVEIGASERQDR